MSSTDSRGLRRCLRGSAREPIKNIVDELAGERIDIVRFSDDMQVLIPNALQPADRRGGVCAPCWAEPSFSSRISYRWPSASMGKMCMLAEQVVRLGYRDHDPRGARRAN